jgi:hypothetical protein
MSQRTTAIRALFQSSFKTMHGSPFGERERRGRLLSTTRGIARWLSFPFVHWLSADDAVFTTRGARRR